MTEITYATRLTDQEKADVADEVQRVLAADKAMDDLLDKEEVEREALLTKLEADKAVEEEFNDEGYGSDEEKARASAEVVTPEPSSIDSLDGIPVSGDASLTPDSLDSPPLEPISEGSEDEDHIEGIGLAYSPEGSAEDISLEKLHSDPDPQKDFIDDLLFGEAGFAGKEPANSEEADEIRRKWKAKGARLEMRAEKGEGGSVVSDPELDDAFVEGNADITDDVPVEDQSPPVSPGPSPIPSNQSSIEDDPFLPQDTDRKVQVFGKKILGRFFPEEETGEDVAARPADDLMQAAVLAVQDPLAREDLISVRCDIDRLQGEGKEMSANGQYLLGLIGAAADVARSEGPFNAEDISLRIQKGIDHTSDGDYVDQPVQSSA